MRNVYDQSSRWNLKLTSLFPSFFWLWGRKKKKKTGLKAMFFLGLKPRKGMSFFCYYFLVIKYACSLWVYAFLSHISEPSSGIESGFDCTAAWSPCELSPGPAMPHLSLGCRKGTEEHLSLQQNQTERHQQQEMRFAVRQRDRMGLKSLGHIMLMFRSAAIAMLWQKWCTRELPHLAFPL